MSTDKKTRIEELWLEVTDMSNDERTSSYHELMNTLRGTGQTDDAIQVGYAWLEYEDCEDGSRSLANSAFWLACVLSEKERHLEALEVSNRSLSRPNIFVEATSIGYLYWHRGTDHGALGNFTEQATNYRKAIEFFDPETDESALGTIHALLGDALAELGLLDESAAAFAQAIAYLEEDEEPDEVAGAKLSLAKVLLQQGHLTMARKYADESFALCEFFGQVNESNDALIVLGRIASAYNDGELAESLLKRAGAKRDTPSDRQTAALAMFYWAVHLATHGRENEAREEFTKVNPILRAVGLPETADKALGHLQTL